MEPGSLAGPLEEAQGGNDRPVPVWGKTVKHKAWVYTEVYIPVHLVLLQELLCSIVP